MITKTSKKAGMSPGTLLHIGEKRNIPISVTRIDYDRDNLIKKKLDTPAAGEISAALLPGDRPDQKDQFITWINVEGIHDVDLVEAVGRSFDLHPLVMEDIVNTQQRPKVEDYEEYLYITVKYCYLDQEKQAQSEQVSLILGNDYVLSFCENSVKAVEAVRERLERGKGRLRKSGADYLAYALLDAIVDHYFILLEHYHEKIEALEDEIFDDSRPQTLQEIHAAKREVLIFHRLVWPLRDLLGQLKKGDLAHLREENIIFFGDIYDHIRQVVDTSESFRDVLITLQELYLSTISQKMNEVMKMLTIIATIFIPLTFIAGIYGMNFEYMPELTRPWAYFAVLGVMALLAGGLLLYFKKKKWL